MNRLAAVMFVIVLIVPQAAFAGGTIDDFEVLSETVEDLPDYAVRAVLRGTELKHIVDSMEKRAIMELEEDEQEQDSKDSDNYISRCFSFWD